MPDTKTILREVLQNLGISQRQAAIKLGIQPSSITNVLSGPNNLSLETCAKWCEGLGYRLEVKTKLRKI